MKERRIVSADKSGNQVNSRGKGEEYVFAQFEFDTSNFVRSIHNETKPRLDKTGPDKYGRNGL